MAKHVLLIDDDPDEIDIFVDALQDSYTELKVTPVSGVSQALDLLEKLVPDCIILDYNMPKINGIEGLVDIRRLEGLRSVPIIMYSNTMDEDLVTIAKELGATSCIKKPYDMRSLPGLLKPYL